MAITGIRSFHYSTNQLDAAKKFYIEALGFELDYEQPGWCALKMGGVQVALHPEENPIPEVPRDSHGPQAGGCLTLKSDNIPEDKAMLQEHGAVILGDNDMPWGHMLVFEDLDKNVLILMNAKY